MKKKLLSNLIITGLFLTSIFFSHPRPLHATPDSPGKDLNTALILSATPDWTVEGGQSDAGLGRGVGTAGDVNGDGYSDAIVGAPDYDNGQSNEGRALLYYGSPGGLNTTPDWTAESNQDNASFGWVATTAGDVNGDGYSDVIVAAHDYDSGQADVGAVFVYHGSATGLSLTPDQTLLGNQSAAGFGISAATAGDVNGDGYSDVIVGMYQYNGGETNEGAAFVYYGSAAGLSATADWTMESNQAEAKFGARVNTAGDVNGDGYSDIIVGATSYTDGESGEGAAFVYYGSATGPSSTANWTAYGDQIDARFSFVSTAGDVNGDGYSDVVVGAGGYDNSESGEGRVSAYYGSAVGLSTTADWSAESNQIDANLGPVGAAGDVNGDGYADVIVGAYLYDNGQSNEGRAYVYYGSKAGLKPTAAWTGESNNDEANYGVTVGTAGDVNGDGYSDIIVGAHHYSNGQSQEGGAFVTYGASSDLDPAAAAWMAESDQAGARLGTSVGTAGDVNGDGYADLLIGADYYDGSLTNEGAVFVFYGAEEGVTGPPDWTATGGLANARLGFSAAAAGDVNGDGYADIIVGAPEYNNGQTAEGAVLAYYGSAGGLSLTPDWLIESNQASAQLGVEVSTAGDVNGDGYADVIVGSHGYDSSTQVDVGAAFVYYGSASGLSSTPAWLVEGNQPGGRYGWDVDTAGDVNGDGYSDIAVAAKWYQNGQFNEGRVYVYHGSAAGLNQSANWIFESNSASAGFGTGLSVAGDVNGDGYSDIIVGAQGYDGGQTDEGRAYVFHGSPSGLSITPNWTVESDKVGAELGQVGTAGDVNGDGYADVFVGVYHYTNGHNWEGQARVYLGSASGLATSPIWTTESNQSNSIYGITGETAGDVNGDGYADIIVGAYQYDNGQTDEGAAFLYYGNRSPGYALRPRQFRTDATTPLAPLGLSDSQTAFNIDLIGRMPLGRDDVKLEWQAAPLGESFSGPHVVAGISSTWTDVLTGSVTLGQQITGLTPDTAYHWRARLRYRPGNALGQSAGRWLHIPWNGWLEQDLRTQGTPCIPVSNVSISRSPIGTIYAGHAVRFTANAVGDAPFGYVWQINSTSVGQNLRTLDHIFATPGTYNVSVVVTNACSQGNASMQVTVSDPGTNLPNLSESYKTVNLTNVEQGDTLIYTIYLHNQSNTPATAILTDTIPAYTSYIPDSAEASDGSPVSVDQAVHWQGQVISGTPVIIEFAVTVEAPPLGTVISNVADLDDGAGNLFQLEAYATYNPGYGLTMNDGDLYTNNRYVSLHYAWNTNEDITTVSFSNDGGFGPGGNTTGWLPVNPDDPTYNDWELAIYGNLRLPRTVYVKFRDSNGLQYGPFQDDIIYDEDAPNCTDLQILPPTTRTTEQAAGQVIVRATVDDDNSGVAKLHISHNADFSDYTEVIVSGNTVDVPWTLQPSGLVYARVFDRAGNVSATRSVQGQTEDDSYNVMLPLIIK